MTEHVKNTIELIIENKGRNKDIFFSIKNLIISENKHGKPQLNIGFIVQDNIEDLNVSIDEIYDNIKGPEILRMVTEYDFEQYDKLFIEYETISSPNLEWVTYMLEELTKIHKEVDLPMAFKYEYYNSNNGSSGLLKWNPGETPIIQYIDADWTKVIIDIHESNNRLEANSEYEDIPF